MTAALSGKTFASDLCQSPRRAGLKLRSFYAQGLAELDEYVKEALWEDEKNGSGISSFSATLGYFKRRQSTIEIS